jgi:hypothetical protein
VDYLISFDLDLFIAQFIRDVEDLLLCHAAFQQYLGGRDNE